jgi:RNA polymerase sigma factor (sigma-70 family)
VELALAGISGGGLAEGSQPFPFRLGLCIVRPVAAEPWTPETEQALVVRAKEGDKKALGLLLTRFGPMLFRSVLLPRLGNTAAAEQALGDTYLRVVERISSFEWQGCGLYPWLRMVALHVAVDLLRARRREVLFGPEDLQREAEASEQDLSDGDLTDSLIERRDLDAARSTLERALEKINPRYASAIRLRIIEERPREEVAQTLGVSTATFDVVLHRAMTALRKAIAPQEPSAGES